MFGEVPYAPIYRFPVCCWVKFPYDDELGFELELESSRLPSIGECIHFDGVFGGRLKIVNITHESRWGVLEATAVELKPTDTVVRAEFLYHLQRNLKRYNIISIDS
jgi:hypothetical protein